MQLIRHGHWWRDDGGWGDIQGNNRDGWDGAGGGGSGGNRQQPLGVQGGRKLTTGKLKYRV